MLCSEQCECRVYSQDQCLATASVGGRSWTWHRGTGPSPHAASQPMSVAYATLSRGRHDRPTQVASAWVPIATRNIEL